MQESTAEDTQRGKGFRALWSVMLLVDVGFLVYWGVTAAHLLPEAWLFKDYDNPILAAWNWSFLPLDLCVSFSGLFGLWRFRRRRRDWALWAIVSLVLSFASGLMAVAFWTLRRDFDLGWWAPNVLLLVYPLVFLAPLLREVRAGRD